MFCPHVRQEPAYCFSLPWTVALRSGGRAAAAAAAAAAVARLSATYDVY